MFLKNLLIENNGIFIREISFHKGFNIIVDETPEEFNDQTSGNNVGKTTVLRLIDFCLGGDGKNIYSDTEFKTKTNSQIELFLKENNICIHLTLVSDLEDNECDEINIVKNFLLYGKKIQTINGEGYNNQEFLKKLNQLIFKNNHDKPTFRQIISKNIRDEKSKLTNTVRVLHSTTRLEEYEALYLFWFGISIDNSKRKEELVRQKNLEKRLQERLKKDNNLSQIIQSLLIIERSIDELNQKRISFDVSDSFEADLESLNQIKFSINSKTSEFGELEIRKELILESKNDLEKDIASIDLKSIRKLYEKAKSFIPNIQTSFEETLHFHNEMVAEKLKFVTKELPEVEERIQNLKKEINTLLAQEKVLSKSIKKAGGVNEFQLVISDLNKQHEKKGALEEQKRLWETSIAKIETIDEELDQINSGIVSKDDLIQSRIAEFNKYFSDISNRLYGERFVLSTDKTDRAYELNITSLEGNLGTGKKKGQIAAFDLAYILFADAMQIPCLHFILHDQIENVHDNQLNTLADLANEINGQYIVPILRDKIPFDASFTQYEVLQLSQTNKLFRLP